ncbi:hypothetical protein KOR34_19200 [Posidoniimonas corsicana]|uniref:Uncharacterized protein n=1 Tax=Posidoniimonas corsicana TaxID=1938618 RepID=A0A5C5VEC0_9BACT|nr:hypothetical protein [Posidoniimonas corsicana]TWT36974.1 hypothetical protein KOR34_19200 [Posidoniimonas corsicana]
MPGFNAKQVVKHSAATALFALTLCPSAMGQAPAGYAGQHTASIHPEVAPYAGPHNYATQVRPFRYGWFGAQSYSPTSEAHRTYYNDVIRWSRWRMY